MSERRLESGQRRRIVRVHAECKAVIAYADGTKREARLLDVSTGGMHLESAPTPDYGVSITVIVRFDDHCDWMLLPGTVRWFSGHGFGVEFVDLDSVTAAVLEDFVDHVAA